MEEAQEFRDGMRLYFTRSVTRGGVIGLASLPAEGGDEKLEKEAIMSRSWELTRKGIMYVSAIQGILMSDPHLELIDNMGAGPPRPSLLGPRSG